MSNKCKAWVEDNSPYMGHAYFIHHTLGDIANETYEFRLFCGDKRLAHMTRISVKTIQRAKDQMVLDGYLELLSDKSAPGRPREYRFLFPETVDKMSSVPDPETVDKNRATVDKNEGNGGHLGDPAPLLIELRLKEEETSTREPPAGRRLDAPFDDFWAAYPRRGTAKVGKANALRLWRRLTSNDRTAALEALPAYTQFASGYPKDPERYIRGRIWEDLADTPCGANASSPMMSGRQPTTAFERTRATGMDTVAQMLADARAQKDPSNES